MRRFLLVVVVSTLALLSPCQAQETTPRRQIGDFVVQMSPLDSSLTAVQASKVRDIVEVLVVDFLEQYEWGGSFTSNIQVATVSLTAVDQMDYVAFTKQVAVSFGGLVYFEKGSIGVPSRDALTELIVQGLTGLLLPALQVEFPLLSGTTLGVLDVVEDDDDEVPPTMAPTPGATSINGVQSGINGGGDKGGQRVGAVAGSVVGGFGIVLLGVMFLLVTRRRKRAVSSLDGDHDLHLEQQHSLDLEKEGGGTLDSIQQARSPSLDDTMDDYAEEDALPPKQPTTPVTTTTSTNKKDAAAESFPPRDEQPPPPSLFGQMFAAAAWFPQRMMMPPTTQVTPEKMTDDYDDSDVASDFDMESFSDFSSSVAIQPHIVPVESMESFEHSRRNMILKKDMMMSREDIPYGKRPQNTRGKSKNNNDSNCALSPTDHSAATLAIATTTSPRSSPPTRLSSSGLRSLTPKFPKISWMRDHPKKQQPNSGYASSSDQDDNNTFASNVDEDNLWDPDDASVGYAASDASTSDVFTPAATLMENNRDDKSRLLKHHHSFQRNDSYKLQRLRTPTGGASPSSRGSRPTVPKSPTMRSSGESIEVNRTCGRSDFVMV